AREDRYRDMAAEPRGMQRDGAILLAADPDTARARQAGLAGSYRRRPERPSALANDHQAALSRQIVDVFAGRELRDGYPQSARPRSPADDRRPRGDRRGDADICHHARANLDADSGQAGPSGQN